MRQERSHRNQELLTNAKQVSLGLGAPMLMIMTKTLPCLPMTNGVSLELVKEGLTGFPMSIPLTIVRKRP